MFPSGDRLGSAAAPWRLPWYILWRVVGALLILLIVLTAVFVAFEGLGNATSILLPRCGNPATRCGEINQAITSQWGLDQPLLSRYAIFLSNVLTGNLGTSARLGRPVWSLISAALPTTLVYLGVTLLLVALVSLGLGLPLSRRKGSLADAVVSVLLALPYSFSILALGLLAFWLFVFAVPLVPLNPGPGSPPIEYDALGTAVLVGSVAGLFTWAVRDHPLTPVATEPPAGDWKPREGRRVARTRVAIAKFLSAMPALIAWTLSTEMLGETVWNVNGLGLLFWTSLLTFDAFVLMGILIVTALVVVLPFLLVADVLHEWLTAGWVRADGRTVRDFDVEPRDLLRGTRHVLDSASGFAGLVLIVLLVGMAAAAPILAGPYPTTFMLQAPNQPPSAGHFLGTDAGGRDIRALVLYGGTPGIPVAILGFALALIACLGIVAVAGLLGPRAAVFVSIPLDAALALSVLFVPLAGSSVLDRSPYLAAFVAWPLPARLLQTEIRGLVPPSRGRRSPRPESRGRRTVNLLWGTGPLILGNALLAVSLTLSLWATLGILGTGGATQIEGWGEILRDAYENLAVLRGQWWYFIPPALCILAAVLAPLLLSFAVKRVPLMHRGGELPWTSSSPGTAPVEVPPPA